MDTSIEPKSRSVFEVIDRRRNVALTVLCVGVVLSILAAIFIRPYYSGSAHIVLVNDEQGRDPVSVGVDLPEIATSSTVLDAVKKQLSLNISITKLEKNISVRVPPRSSLMTVSAQDHDPDEAIAITNSVARNFVDLYTKLSGSRYQNVVTQLRDELSKRRAHILELENVLQRSASESSYVGSQTSLDNTASNLTSLATQRILAYSQLVSDQAEYDLTRIQGTRLSKIIRHETLSNDQNYRQLEIQVSHDNANLTIRRASETDQYPGLAEQIEAVAAENRSLDHQARSAIDSPSAYSPSLGGQITSEQKAAAAVAGDQARVKALDQQIRLLQNGLARVPKNGENVGATRAMRDAEEAQYQQLALRLSNAQANSAEANSLGSAMLVDPAEVARPNLLTTGLLLAVLILVSIAAAVAAAYVAESADPRFISPSDVEAVYGKPQLGFIGA